MSDLISRQAAIDALVKAIREDPYYDSNEAINGLGVCDVRVILNDLPSAQPEKRTEKRTETHACDLIERQAANTNMKKYRKKPIVIEAYKTDVALDIETLEGIMHASVGDYIITGVNGEQYPCKPDIFKKTYEEISSAQPERTCVNCGRTANNGGWYADGGTRCPIEEHYALPKDGYCHLWEKRNVTDDDYPERREE